MEFTLNVNGAFHTVDVDPQKPLLWVLRENIDPLVRQGYNDTLTGTKFGCGIGTCGVCAVLLDGVLTKSCVVAVKSVVDKQITTIEGLNDDLGKAIKEAWISEKVSQCGYCQPGQIITAYAILSNNSDPSDDDLDENMTSLCRCGTYQRIRTAIKVASETIKQKKLKVK
jgi:isoquinoline 1-oxidoreductase alpha subunit